MLESIQLCLAKAQLWKDFCPHLIGLIIAEIETEDGKIDEPNRRTVPKGVMTTVESGSRSSFVTSCE